MGEEKKEGKFNEMELFEVAMARKWAKVVEVYKKYPEAHTALLTKSKETALHIAISSFHSKCARADSDARCIEQMMDILAEKGKLKEVVKMENLRKDTLLHLAAAVGSDHICHRLVTNYSIMREFEAADKEILLLALLKKRNDGGETPLFVAAHHGNLQTFLSLSKAYDGNAANEQNKLEPLRRSKDGDTVLHSAISGEYFDLAYQIMKKYPLLIHRVNANGESPLYRLARKPNVFKSSSHLRLYDSIIYKCVFVDELKQQEYKPKANIRDSDLLRRNMPSNYMTCGDILYHLWSLFLLITGIKSCNKESENPIDEENPQKKLTSFGKIKKIKVKKERYHNAMEIMNEMITQETRYRYGSTSS